MARLNNRCHPDELRDFVEHGGHDPEEFPFLEEQSVLRRLEATLFSLRNWSMTKSKAALNNWHVRDFVLITQGDLLNAQDCYKLLQVIIEQLCKSRRREKSYLASNGKYILFLVFYVMVHSTLEIPNCLTMY